MVGIKQLAALPHKPRMQQQLRSCNWECAAATCTWPVHFRACECKSDHASEEVVTRITEPNQSVQLSLSTVIAKTVPV
eukprot:8485812-Lingulodinium_polyedra.AAC.1